MEARLTFLEVICPPDRGYWEHDVRRGTSTFVGEVSFWISHPTLPGIRPFFLNAPLTMEIQTPPGLMLIPATLHIATPPPNYWDLSHAEQYSDGRDWFFGSPEESSQETDPSEETGVESRASHP